MGPSRLRRLLAVLVRRRDQLGLSVAATRALLAGLISLVMTTVVFGGLTEDVTRHDGLSTTDPLHLHWFVEHRPNTLVSAARVVTEIGSLAALVLVVATAAVVLRRRGEPLLLALAPGIALGLSATSAAVAKGVVARSRPPVALHLATETDASFPSGHATNATAVYLTLGFVVAIFVLRRPLTRCASVLGSGLLAAAIGASRLVLAVHWPTDVVAGWALGASVALVVTISASLATRLAPRRSPPLQAA